MSISTLLLTSVLAIDTLVNGASLPHHLSQRDVEPTCLGKDQGSTFDYTTSKDTYDVLCGQDYWGGDLRSLQAASFNDCLVACDAEVSCGAVGYVGTTCYLKNKLTTAVINTEVWSAKKQIAPQAGLSCIGKADDGKLYQALNGQFKIVCGQEYYGGDLTSTSTATFEACIEECATNTQCVDVSYVNGACYLKKTITSLVAADLVWTAQLIGAQPQTTTKVEELTCLGNADNGKPHTTKTGRTYTVECGIDYAGGDLYSLESTTFETCMEACDAATGCVDVSWAWGTCYLKNTLTEGSPVDYVWTGRWIEAAQSSSTSSDSSATSSATSSSASSTVSSSVVVSTSSSTSVSSNTVSSVTATSSSTTSSGPTACPSGSTFAIGVTSIYSEESTIYEGQIGLVPISADFTQGWVPGFSDASGASASRFTFDSTGLLVTANDMAIKAAADSDSWIPYGYFWFGTTASINSRSHQGNPGAYARCTRDRTKTPNTISCGRAVDITTTTIWNCGWWLIGTPAIPEYCDLITLTVEDEVCL